MRNPPQPYKHAGENDLNFSQSGDSSLLAKKRQNFASGGGAYPIQGASGSARWQGAGPEYYPAMRAEMSPRDFEIFRSQVSPEEYNTFMGITPAAQPAQPAAQPAAPTPPPAPLYSPQTLPAAPEFKPQAWNPQTAAKPALPPQAQQNVQPYVKSGPVV